MKRIVVIDFANSLFVCLLIELSLNLNWNPEDLSPTLFFLENKLQNNIPFVRKLIDLLCVTSLSSLQNCHIFQK